MPNSNQSVPCRVQNLASAKGRLLNGLAASFDPTATPPQPGRVAVTIDGVKLEMSLKPGNLLVMKSECKELTVTVGRSDLRSREANAVVVDNTRERAVSRVTLNSTDGPALRSKGILLALLEYFNTQRLPDGNIVIHLTDLNLALLLNSYAEKKTLSEKLDPEQDDLAKKVGGKIIFNCRKRVILFKYSPFRIERGDFPSEEVLQSVRASNFHIYPCPCDTYLDALEVRFLLPGRLSHAFFLDFGQGETIQYVKNLASMAKDMDRFAPHILADVDPQMFWSSVLHSKAVIKVLKDLPQCPGDLIKEWTEVCGSYIKSVVNFKEVCFSVGEAVRILPDAEGKWNLINDKIHYNIAYRNAKLAVLMGITDWKPMGPLPSIEISDNYKGSTIELKINELAQASAAISTDPQDIEIVVKDILSWNETKTCDYCGIQNKKMFDCTRCEAAGYCSKECQRHAWPAHKKVCKTLKKEIEEEVRAGTDQNDSVKTRLYNPKKLKNPSQFQIFAEACGVGYLRIINCPENGSLPNVVTFKALKRNTIFKIELESLGGANAGSLSTIPKMMKESVKESDDAKVFHHDLLNLDPIMRLCLACGPVPNIDIAKNALDDALIQAGGSVSNLKMKWAGFTPLEWAAKKGHMDIVKWLVSDPRTTSLIKVGTPVGWACYTDRVKIAKFLVKRGASAEATNEVFWDSRPPLLAAAENGKLKAVMFLVEECRVPISVKWNGNGIKEHVYMSPGWEDEPHFQAILKFVKLKGVH